MTDPFFNKPRRKTVTKVIKVGPSEQPQRTETPSGYDNFTMLSDLSAIQNWNPNPLTHSNSTIGATPSNFNPQYGPDTLHPNYVNHMSMYQPPEAHLQYTQNQEANYIEPTMYANQIENFVEAGTSNQIDGSNQPIPQGLLLDVPDMRPKAKTSTQPRRWQNRHATVTRRESDFSAEKELFSYINSKLHHEAAVDENGNIIPNPTFRPPIDPPQPKQRKSLTSNKRPKLSWYTRLKQQDISGHYFIPSSKCVMVCNLFLGLFLLLAGGIILGVSNTVIEYDIPYNSNCTLDSICPYPFTLEYDIPGPVYFYIKVENLYQNHQRYIRSLEAAQLNGDNLSLSELNDCSPIQNVSELDPSQQFALDGTELDPSAPANPCGLFAASFFTDTFSLLDQNNNSIPISTKDIAWSVDKNSNFKRHALYKSTQWVDVEDERFMNWMNFATLPDWKKLWGRIDRTLPAGDYSLVVNNVYDVNSFDGDKWVTLSTITWFGGTTLMLSVIFLSLGGIYFGLAIIVFFCGVLKRIDEKKIQQGVQLEWTF